MTERERKTVRDSQTVKDREGEKSNLEKSIFEKSMFENQIKSKLEKSNFENQIVGPSSSAGVRRRARAGDRDRQKEADR